MPSRFTASVPVSEWAASSGYQPLPSYQQTVALMRRLDEQNSIEADKASCWLDYCARRQIFHCFTKEFVTRLARLIRQIGPHICVEVAAGTGLLSASLRTEGISVIATDTSPINHNVVRLNAQQALEQLAPDLVVACWPPTDANVEITVLQAPSVSSFIFIGQKINEQIGTPQMWSHSEWSYSLREDLLEYSLCRYDYFAEARQAVVKHSYPFCFSRKGPS